MNRRVALSAIGAMVALSCVACGGDGDDPPTGAASTNGEQAGTAEGTALEVSAVDNSFDPSALKAAPGSEVTLEITNDGSNPHTFTIDDLDVDTGTIAAGESATATFTMPDETVTFYCVIHGEDAMSGTIATS